MCHLSVRTEVWIRRPRIGVFGHQLLRVHTEPLAPFQECQRVTQCPLFAVREDGFDLRDTSHPIASPDPVVHAAAFTNRSMQVPWSCLQQSDCFDEIRLAGSVRTDQHVERLELQLLRARTEREYVGQPDAVDQHGSSSSVNRSRWDRARLPPRGVARSAWSTSSRPPGCEG